ncbi:hypothetical protein [Ruminococcus sp.]|uniref:vWA domain-containing protein n=1 Tax=Ruminococcus sp. TaxID=41978 RepID=UPI0025FE7553|nr:hypothetical protein [Ruminococcus sp.]MBR1430152.1 hypothetical protein [Ruminococcus sp.]
MKQTYRNIDDVLRSPWADISAQGDTPHKTDRIYRSTKLEDSIYNDVRRDDTDMDTVENEAKAKLSTFPALSRDVYQSFYSLMPKKNDEAALSGVAQKFNSRIMDHITASEDYPTIKNICEGRDLPAYEAATEFITKTAGELDELLADFGGDKGALSTLEKLQNAEQKARDEFSAMLERLRQSKERNEALEKQTVEAANKAESKHKQVEAVSKLIDATAAKNKDKISALLSRTVKSAAEKADEVKSIIGAWGNDPANMERSEVNTELLKLVRSNPKLKAISDYLGRFREMFSKGKKNGYAYGRGEKYSIELGNDISRAITSELAMLATPETTPLFLRKYQLKQIKQYRRREPIYKGMGDIIVCLDESGSTEGDPEEWGKAVALTLLDIAADSSRKFALVHFASAGIFKTDLFLPGEYTAKDKKTAAETFLNGGTDFETPLRAAMELIENGGFENTDIVFLTDGECELPQAYAKVISEKQAEKGFTVTGILLDANSPGMDFSLKPFCQKIYRTSELMGDEIVEDIVNTHI